MVFRTRSESKARGRSVDNMPVECRAKALCFEMEAIFDKVKMTTIAVGFTGSFALRGMVFQKSIISGTVSALDS